MSTGFILAGICPATQEAVVTTFNALTDTPSGKVGKAGDKVIVADDEANLVYAPSTTSSGFYEDVEFSYDRPSNTLSINPVAPATEFQFVTASGERFAKAMDSIVVAPYDGLVYIHYDNTGTLQQTNGLDRVGQWEAMATSLPVAYGTYESAFGTDPTFWGDYAKPRVSGGAWLDTFYRNQVDVLEGVAITDYTIGSGTLDADAQVGLSSGSLQFATRLYPTSTRLPADAWNVGFYSGSAVVGVEDSPYFVLSDVQLGVGITGLACYNNDGSPQSVPSGNYVWYFFGISVDIDQSDRTLAFMGNGTYSNTATALDHENITAEIRAIEDGLLIRQGFALKFAVLLESKNTFSNAPKSRIVQIREIISAVETREVEETP